MESKLNYSAIESFANAWSGKFIEHAYKEKEHLTGDDILSFPVPQVGLLVLQQIYTNWANEAEKLESPYFNYQATEVQSGIKKLMNVLSKNIAVRQEDISPLLRKSVYDTIVLTISPYAFFSKLLKEEHINKRGLEELKRFIKINASVLTALIDQLGDDMDTASLNEVLAVTCAPDKIEDPTTILEKFSDLHPVNEASFLITTGGGFDDDDQEEILSDSNTLHDSFVSNGNYETLADRLQHSQAGTGSLKSMLSINQKFMFISDLFNDNQEDFYKVIDFLETCETLESASSFIHNNYLKHNIWNANSPQVKEFMQLIEKKFS